MRQEAGSISDAAIAAQARETSKQEASKAYGNCRRRAMSASLQLHQVWASHAAPAIHAGAIPEPVVPIAFHRRHAEAMLRRYLQLSMQMGRMPSVLGDCVDRGMVSSRRIRSFEDAVIFVFDVEKCLKKLDGLGRALVAHITLEEYTQAEVASMLGLSVKTVTRRYNEALDRLSGIFLEAKLFTRKPPENCQEPGLCE
jgi:hypothetical protein